MSTLIRITSITGRPLPLRGNDIDTDRIIPARFMKAVTFDGMGQHAFHDARFNADGSLKGHVMDDPRFQAKGDRIAVVNKNFGCGSSREHAPQALLRWGVKALVGESFADIFFGNCVALGMPCVTASAEDVLALQAAIEASPESQMTIDLEAMQAQHAGKSYTIELPTGARKQLLDGSWDATRLLLQAEAETRRTYASLPYTRMFND